MKKNVRKSTRYTDSVRGCAYVSAPAQSAVGNGVHSTKTVGGDLRSRGTGRH